MPPPSSAWELGVQPERDSAQKIYTYQKSLLLLLISAGALPGVRLPQE